MYSRGGGTGEFCSCHVQKDEVIPHCAPLPGEPPRLMPPRLMPLRLSIVLAALIVGGLMLHTWRQLSAELTASGLVSKGFDDSMRAGPIARDHSNPSLLSARLALLGGAVDKGAGTTGKTIRINATCWCGSRNFGDMLAMFIVERIAASVSTSGTTLEINWVPIKVRPRHVSSRLFSVGSLIQRAKDGDVVWGTGSIVRNLNLPREDIAGIHFLAFRGPLSRRVVLKNLKKYGIHNASLPEVYGDPALLLPRFYNVTIEKVHDRILLAHAVHYKDLAARFSNILPVINAEYGVRQNWTSVVDAILSARLVMSTSLHGVIIAETYGIRAYLIKPEGLVRLAGGRFKFDDYYESTGRSNWTLGSLEWLTRPDEELPQWTAPAIDLEPLVASFPFRF